MYILGYSIYIYNCLWQLFILKLHPIRNGPHTSSKTQAGHTSRSQPCRRNVHTCAGFCSLKYSAVHNAPRSAPSSLQAVYSNTYFFQLRCHLGIDPRPALAATTSHDLSISPRNKRAGFQSATHEISCASSIHIIHIHIYIYMYYYNMYI